MSALVAADEQSPLASAPDPLRQAFALMAYGLTETSKRQYRHSFNPWLDHCSGGPARQTI